MRKRRFFRYGLSALAGSILPAGAAERYSSWRKEDIVRIALKYIADTKKEFELRAAAVYEETGDNVELDYKYMASPTEEEEKRHERFVAVRLSTEHTYLHIREFMKDLERVRAKLAEAEAKAFESWEKKHGDDPPDEPEMITAEVFGQVIESRRIAAVLDHSPSMKPYLETLRAEIEGSFPGYRSIEVWGSFLRMARGPVTNRSGGDSHDGYEPWRYVQPRIDQNPFDPRWYNPKIPLQNVHYFVTGLERDNLSALRALIEYENIDAIYWFCDFDDDVEDRAVAALGALLKKHKTKLYVHTLKRRPPRKMTDLIEASGGAVIRKRLRK